MPTEKPLHSQTLIQNSEHTSAAFRPSLQNLPTALVFWLSKGEYHNMAPQTQNILLADSALPPTNDCGFVIFQHYNGTEAISIQLGIELGLSVIFP
jgi:hypothetical protein